VINKIDRPDARPQEVLDEIYDLFIDLDAEESQLDFPVLYAVAKQGTATSISQNAGTDLQPLFRAIVETIPEATGDPERRAANSGHQPRLFRLFRPHRHLPRLSGHACTPATKSTSRAATARSRKTSITKLFTFSGLKRIETRRDHHGRHRGRGRH
jgi:GTP-binding protein